MINLTYYLVANDVPETNPDIAVLIDVCQLTAPFLPKPDWLAPEPRVTVSPDSPSVKVVPHCGATVFTSILDND